MADWFCLIHTLPGRIRIRVTLERPSMTQLRSHLEQSSGVRAVRLNAECHSALIEYDPGALTHSDIVDLLEDFTVTSGDRVATSDVPEPESDAWWSLGLSTAAVLLGWWQPGLTQWLLAVAAAPMYSRAYDSIINKGTLNVDVLDAAATTVLSLQGRTQTAATMVWLVSFGDWIRDFTMQSSQRSIEGLLSNVPQSAWVLREGRKVRLAVTEVREGDHVVVYPGELLPVDGTVVRGKATVDQTILTGESVPAEKSTGDDVYAATVIREGKLYIQAAHIGKDTAAARIVQLVRDVPMRETRIQNYAEAFADRLVPWSLAGAGASYAMTGQVDAAASLLIVDYGTGIRVAAPTTILSAMTRAARHGIVIKGGRFMERLTQVDTVVFDKTGTLTTGIPDIVDIVPYHGASANDVLAVAASAEARLKHPVAEAIVRAARVARLDIPERHDSHYTVGLGVEARVNGSTALVGCNRFMALKGVSCAAAEQDFGNANGRAASPVFVAVDGRLIGLIEYADPVRPESEAVIRALRDRGIARIVMLTGDYAAVAGKVAAQLGITEYLADALPDQKLEYVRALQREGRVVAVVGDGINDSPALAEADVGIAVRGGTDVARETAGVVLIEGNLTKIPEAIDIARQGMDLIQQNWNLIAYPNSAAIGLSLLGWLGPIGATLISNGSALVATLNGLRPLLAQPSASSPAKTPADGGSRPATSQSSRQTQTKTRVRREVYEHARPTQQPQMV